jgi:hypothetical protein
MYGGTYPFTPVIFALTLVIREGVVRLLQLDKGISSAKDFEKNSVDSRPGLLMLFIP